MRPWLVASRSPLAITSVMTLLACGVACSSAPHEQAAGDAGAPDSSVDAGLDSGPGCANVTPSACPAPQPSYATDVLPILQTHCYECHADGGVDQSHSGIDLGSYDAVYGQRGSILSQVSQCRMPPAVAPAGLPPPVVPTDTERATLLGWIKCGSPDD